MDETRMPKRMIPGWVPAHCDDNHISQYNSDPNCTFRKYNSYFSNTIHIFFEYDSCFLNTSHAQNATLIPFQIKRRVHDFQLNETEYDLAMIQTTVVSLDSFTITSFSHRMVV